MQFVVTIRFACVPYVKNTWSIHRQNALFVLKANFFALFVLFCFLFSAPSHASTASLSDRQSHQKDTTSVASSRASIIPTYDDVSLNQRNAAANKAERNGVNQSTGPPRRSSRSSRLSLDSQEKSVDQGGQFYDSVDVVTNIPKPQKQAGPKDIS